jgi:hypothetical protein
MRRFPTVPAALAAAYAGTDWAASPLGPMGRWSATLRGTVDLMLATRFPVTLFWGPEFALVYNEAYVPLIRDKHPGALGTPAREVFPEVWDLIGPMMDSARQGAPTWVQDEHVPLRRRGFLEECYFTFSYSPVRNEVGEVEGVMDIATETTEQVISRRRLQLLSAVAARIANAQDLEDLVRLVLPLLRDSTEDLPAVDIRLPGTQVDDRHRLPRSPSEGGPVLTERVESPGAEDAVLGACRALVKHRRDRWLSKVDAGLHLVEDGYEPSDVIREALAARSGGPAVSGERASQFQVQVLQQISGSNG